MSEKQFFGTDGIRGTVGEAPITPDFMLRLGHAVGQVMRRAGPAPGRPQPGHAAAGGGDARERGGGHSRPTVLIGKDTRISGYMIESALEAGFASAGVDVLLTGPLPTPGVAYLTRALRLDLGVVISASHNAYPDNGVKFFSARGEKLDDGWERAVEAALGQSPRWVDSKSLGRARRLDDATGRYVEFCKGTVSGELSLRGLKIAVDAAHGAAYQAAPSVLHELGAEVVAIGTSPDGHNINDGVGATAPQALVERVRSSGAAFGIALDGDADRVQMVDADGRLYNGDELLWIIAADRLDQGLPLAGVVGTLMTNMAVEKALAARGVPFARSAVGDRYVLEELLGRGWQLGGEGSGHILALDKHTTGDGIVSALLVLQAALRSGRSMAALVDGVGGLYPQTLVNVRLAAGADWKGSAALARARSEVERELGDSGRILIRPSGTEPVVRVMVEARDAALAQRSADRLAIAIAER